MQCLAILNRHISRVYRFLQYVFTIDIADSGHPITSPRAWWRHEMGTFSALLAICAGNSPVPGEFSAQRPVTRSFDVFFDLRLVKRLSKQSWGWWFETLSCALWRHCNGCFFYELKAMYGMSLVFDPCSALVPVVLKTISYYIAPRYNNTLLLCNQTWKIIGNFRCHTLRPDKVNWSSRWFPDSKVHEAYVGPTWGRQDPGVSHVGPMNFAIRGSSCRVIAMNSKLTLLPF